MRIKKNEREIEQVMEDTMKVLNLLEELEDIVDDATGLPLSNKIMVDAEEIFRLSERSDWLCPTMCSRRNGSGTRETGSSAKRRLSMSGS